MNNGPPIHPSASILIQSCDAYRDTWIPFFTLFFRYWNDINLPVFLCSESEKFNDTRVQTLLTGSGKTWSQMLLEALMRIETKYVILLLDDYLLYKKVENARIAELLRIADMKSAVCLRLFPEPGPDLPLQDCPGIGTIGENAAYRVSTQAAIWNRMDLISLLNPSESAWEFEYHSQQRSLSLRAPFLSVQKEANNPHYPYTYVFTGIVRGRWTREALRLCRKENITLDLTYRKTKPFWDPLFQSLYQLAPIFLRHVMDFVYSRLVPSFRPGIK